MSYPEVRWKIYGIIYYSLYKIKYMITINFILNQTHKYVIEFNLDVRAPSDKLLFLFINVNVKIFII